MIRGTRTGTTAQGLAALILRRVKDLAPIARIEPINEGLDAGTEFSFIAHAHNGATFIISVLADRPPAKPERERSNGPADVLPFIAKRQARQAEAQRAGEERRVARLSTKVDRRQKGWR